VDFLIVGVIVGITCKCLLIGGIIIFLNYGKNSVSETSTNNPVPTLTSTNVTTKTASIAYGGEISASSPANAARLRIN
jgi:hypothetical protein